MKKKRAALAVLGIAAGIWLAGCAQQAKDAGWKANENSVYVTKEGQVQSALVYSSEQFNELYQEEELKAFAQEAVDAYNQERASALNETGAEGETPFVALQSCKLENRTGYLVFAYRDCEEYPEFAAFSGDNTNTITELRIVSSGDTVEADELLAGISLVKADGKAADTAEVLKAADYSIIAVEGAGTVCTEGRIAFTSEGVTLKNSYTAVTGEGENRIIVK